MLSSAFDTLENEEADEELEVAVETSALLKESDQAGTLNGQSKALPEDQLSVSSVFLQPRFACEWPSLWKMFCEHLQNTSLLTGYDFAEGLPTYGVMKKATLAFARENPHYLFYIPVELLRELSSCENPILHDRKMRNALSRLSATYSGINPSTNSMPAASFQDVMRVVLKAHEYLNSESVPEEDLSQPIILWSARSLQWVLQAALAPEIYPELLQGHLES